MRRVHIQVAPAYAVLIGNGALKDLLPLPGRLAVVVDEAVHRLHGERIAAILGERPREVFVLPSGERQKTLRTAETLYDWLAKHRFERNEPIIAVGGGVCGDLTGFVAATWRRGVPFVQAPTTLLAQVDASVGGKVAVDHPSGKNLIGAFHQPRQVLADTSFLTTLPVREVWAGLAEIVKTALLFGEPLFSTVSSSLESLAGGAGPVEEVVAECVAFKAGVVQRDPMEHGERAILNLGHTVGHALETVGGYERLLHGEAVAYGLRAALELSGLPADSPAGKLIRRLKAPPLGRMAASDVLEAMRTDKKVSGGRVKFVLLDGVGRPRWNCDVAPERTREVVERLVAGEL
jgi:3-dehydroquinate synthase